MKRREFVHTSCIACMTGLSIASVLESCGTTNLLNAEIDNSDLIIPISEFKHTKNSQISFKKYLVVHNDTLQYPICIYRFNENQYSALWMRCSHQGTELQVFGDKLQCPAHGSEFNSLGEVMNTPASQPLRKFSVKIENEQLRISLKS